MLRRLDAGLARGEAAITAVVLLAMIVMAALQALLRNLGDYDVSWAANALEELSWIDPFLQNGTLWVAFLGASLATHHDKHIAIDVVTKILPRRPQAAVKGVIGIAAATVAFFLARVFYQTILNKAPQMNADDALDLGVLTLDGSTAHICDVSRAAVADVEGLTRPDLFCAVRDVVFKVTGVSTATWEAMLQLIIPAMLVVISVRMLFRGLDMLRRAAVGEQPQPIASTAAVSGAADGHAGKVAPLKRGAAAESQSEKTAPAKSAAKGLAEHSPPSAVKAAKGDAETKPDAKGRGESPTSAETAGDGDTEASD